MPNIQKRNALRWIAVLILLVGYGGAFLAWRTQARLDEQAAAAAADPSAPVDGLDSRSQTRQIEQLYGTSGVVWEGILEWCKRQSSGRNLARNLVIVTSVTACVCFLLANPRGELGTRPGLGEPGPAEKR